MHGSAHCGHGDTMTKDWKAKIEELGINSPIAHDLLFKAQLGIGERAYTSLKNADIAITAGATLTTGATGAAVVSLPSIAALLAPAPTGIIAWLSGTGILGWAGLAPAVAAPPVAAVVAAIVLFGGAGYGVRTLLKRRKYGKTVEVPNFINTPLDLLAFSIFFLVAPLALKMACTDDKLTDDEFGRIAEYFIYRWGYNPVFVQVGLQFYSEELATPAKVRAKLKKDGMKRYARFIKEFNEEEHASNFVAFVEANKDCNHQELSKNVAGFLRDVMQADGEVNPREEKMFKRIETILLDKK